MALVDDAVAQIQQLIRSGALNPGQKLPPEAELAAQLGMSRNPLREAVKVLAARRVLDVRRGDGTYITELSPALLFEGLGEGVDLLRDRHLVEVLEVRRMLEAAAASAAAARAEPAHVAVIRGHLDAMVGAGTDIEGMVEHDMAFHRSIAAVVGNEFLLSVLDGIARSTERVRVLRGLRDADAVSRTIREHQAILGAIEARDPGLAYAAAAQHIATSEAWLRQASHEFSIDTL